MDVNGIAIDVAESVLRHCSGAGYWKLYKEKETRQMPDEDTADGLKVGDTIFEFDCDTMQFNQTTVAYVDKNGIAYRLVDDEGDTKPNLFIIWNHWATTKEAALRFQGEDFVSGIKSAAAIISEMM